MLIREYKNDRNNGYVVPGDGEYLSNLKKINIFVGANNSGKSRFLRKIFQAGNDSFVFFEKADEYNQKIKQIYERVLTLTNGYYLTKDLGLLKDVKTGNYASRFNKLLLQISETTQRLSSSAINGVSEGFVAKQIKRELDSSDINKSIPEFSLDNLHIYVPMLRGLRQVDEGVELGKEKDLFKVVTLKEYNIAVEKDKEVFSGLSVYEEIKKMLLGSREDRQIISDYQDFLGDNFFEGKHVTLISDYGTNSIKIHIEGKKQDRELCHVGDGISSIIIATFQAFRHKNENLILFLEEPELTMHPSAQRILIETYINKFPNLQIFLTTHSNHFLDLTYDYSEDVSIFSFEEKEPEKFYVSDLQENSKILDLLGIRNSSVFLANCVIWTEGVTDRMFLRKLFEIKSSFEYKEDYNYTFAEYGGGNLENFDFAESGDENKVSIASLSKKNYLIADNDNITDKRNPKRKRLKRIKRFLGEKSFFDFHIEIENLIPFKIWVKVVKNILKEHPNQKIELKDNYDKNEEEFDRGLIAEKIGTLLRGFLVQSKGAKPCAYFKKENVECLGLSKKEIMTYVLNVIDEESIVMKDFPKMTQKLCLSLEEFIKTANNR